MVFPHPEAGHSQKAFGEACVIGESSFQIKGRKMELQLSEHANAGWSQVSLAADWNSPEKVDTKCLVELGLV